MEIAKALGERLAVRPRIAFVLGVAGDVTGVLADNTVAFRIAQDALAHAWKWEEGGQVPALRLYEDHVEAIAVQGSLISRKRASAAMNTVTSAFYYVLWHAFRCDFEGGQVLAGDIPNDMADVTENVIDEVCAFAMQTDSCHESRILSLAERLLKDFPAANPAEMGPIVTRAYFA